MYLPAFDSTGLCVGGACEKPVYLCFVDRVFICKYGVHACVLSVIRGRGRGMLAWPVARRTCLVFGSDQKEKCRVTV